MIRLQVLPAACGDCLWLEYGTPEAARIVIIDGGLRATASVLHQRLDAARRQRNVDTLDVELLVVTHIDNDHILGAIELLATAPPWLRIKDIWFNGRPQLMRLPTPTADTGRTRPPPADHPADLMGDADAAAGEDYPTDDPAALRSAADLLGRQQADDLSNLLATRRLPWNRHPVWQGEAIRLPDNGDLPVVTLDGDLRLTLLGPTLERLYALCAKWSDVLGGTDEPIASAAAGPADLLGRRDNWPPQWRDGEQEDPSAANGSSIMLLAEYGAHTLLLPGDGHAPDLAAALGRVCRERRAPDGRLPLAAFKLSHHGSDNNLTRAVLERVDCRRYLVSTDGSSHRHPDQQALLRILRYSKGTPELHFNYAVGTTLPWRDSKSDVLDADRVGVALDDYATRFPDDPADGLILELD